MTLVSEAFPKMQTSAERNEHVDTPNGYGSKLLNHGILNDLRKLTTFWY